MANNPPSPPQHPLWRRTPLVESAILSRSAGCRIFLKLENLQPSSSFKSRGIGNFVRKAADAAAVAASQSAAPTINGTTTQSGPEIHFYISSGGNAGLAAISAATTLGYPCTVALPTSASPAILAKLRAAGASDVLVHGHSWFEADQYLRETVMPDAEARSGVKGIYVPPFDHEDVWEGHSTMIGEIEAQMRELGEEDRPNAIVCSVGGGGLLSGVIQGAQKAGWVGREAASNGTKTKIIATETVGAESLHKSLEAGKQVTLPGITSIAASLGAVRVADRAFELASDPSNNVVSAVLTDAEAAMGCWRFADDERMLVEPACGVSVALAYEPDRLRELVGGDLNRESKVVIVVCGGSRIDLDTLEEYRRKYGKQIEEMRLSGNGDVPSALKGV
ncbi:L-serine dehydratase [Cyphellophora attinorum]|uniref:L-serine ammonia-lyase n=1 Tax=Cyphellophora attinorum TaxID=1664694 RepID=A0A0N1HI36_9EURO|nr:L-serine dehydratase [Phialophora attinorum]KPI45890.1 L-serine dehydratase [Phialophora attinorum]